MESYLDTFSYEARIFENARRTADNAGDNSPKFSTDYFIFAAQSFVDLPNHEFTPQLLEELALPLKEEAYASYATYTAVATDVQKSLLVRQALHSIETLSADERRAFGIYLFSSPRQEGTYQALQSIVGSKLTAADFDILRNQPVHDRALATLLSTDLPIGASDFPQLSTLADAIRTNITKVDDRYQVQKLLESEVGQVPVYHLFSEAALGFVRQLGTLNPEQRKIVFQVAADPVSIALSEVISADLQSTTMLEKFRSLSTTDREGLLHYLAISFYRAGGVASLGPFDVLVAQARTVSEIVANIFASIAVLPVFVIAILVAGALARALLVHDKTRQIISVERAAGAHEQYKLGTPTDIFGREDTIADLAKLSGRGWGSLAIVGRRGVGKSRVLYSVYDRSVTRSSDDPPSIGVWLTAPAQFREEEFVASLFERLARASEAAIAKSLNAEPLAVRGMSHKVIRDASIIIGLGAAAVACLLYDILKRLARDEITVAWIPIYIVFASALIVLGFQWLRLQPLDLSPWLDRERSQSPHAVLLYRRIKDAFSIFMPGFVDPAIIRQETRRRQVTLVLGIVLITACVLCALGSAATDGSNREFFFNCALISGLAGGFFLLLRGPASKEPRSLGVIALVSEYRAFASEVIYRLRQGAIGGASPEHGRIVVCIDELDKIVDYDDLRNALRRIKTVFEVEGCYYIMSLAEDAMRRLYLGAVDGKTEVDSALDHVVELMPLGSIDMFRVVTHYLSSIGEKEVDEKVRKTIVALSFGISRDALRVADEWHASKDRGNCAKLVRAWRMRQVRYSEVLGTDLRQVCEGDARVVVPQVEAAVRLLLTSSDAIDSSAKAKLRALVMAWTMCLIEIGCEAPDGQFAEIVEVCMQIGYQVADQVPEAAVAKLQSVWSGMLPKVLV